MLLDVIRKRWKLLLATIAGISSLIVFSDQIKDMVRSKHDRYHNENFVDGTLKPPVIDEISQRKELDSTNELFVITTLSDTKFVSPPPIYGIDVSNFESLESVTLKIGRSTFEIPVDSFYKGFDLMDAIKFARPIPPHRRLNFTMGVINGRLYVSNAFKDFKNEDIIGIIRYNHWSLYKPNMLDFYNDDKTLEVKDKQGNVVFYIAYRDKTIYIAGYIVTPINVIVLGNDPNGYNSVYAYYKSNPDWKQQASQTISTIISQAPPPAD